jgi:hypothetical protein
MDYIIDSVLSIDQVLKSGKYSEIIKYILDGLTALFIDDCDECLIIETRGYEKRSVDKPVIETVVKGSQEGFTENLKTNLVLIRRIVRNKNLITEILPVGKTNNMSCSVMFIKGITNPKIVEEVKAELTLEGIAFNLKIKIGIMVEIPSIAIMADIAASEVDFASIGTNDLCQYLTAVDRLNPNVAQYYQSFHPAMFRLIANVVKEFQSQGKVVSVCGEMGGDPLAATILIGLGMRKLSMNASSVPSIKRLISQINIVKAERIARTVLKLSTAAQVETFLKSELPDAK